MNYTLKQKAIKRLDDERKERDDNDNFEKMKKEIGIENVEVEAK